MMSDDVKPALVNLPYIHTQRLLLRPLKLSDSKDIFEYSQLSEVVNYSIGHAHQSSEEAERFIGNVLECSANNTAGLWGIEWAALGKIVGTCGYEYWLADQYRAEIGYSLSPKFWNRGIMSEAIAEIIKYGFETMDLNRIEAVCHSENTASHRVLEKNGFLNEAFLKRHTYSRGQYFDVFLFSKLSPFNTHSVPN